MGAKNIILSVIYCGNAYIDLQLDFLFLVYIKGDELHIRNPKFLSKEEIQEILDNSDDIYTVVTKEEEDLFKESTTLGNFLINDKYIEKIIEQDINVIFYISLEKDFRYFGNLSYNNLQFFEILLIVKYYRKALEIIQFKGYF